MSHAGVAFIHVDAVVQEEKSSDSFSTRQEVGRLITVLCLTASDQQESIPPVVERLVERVTTTMTNGGFPQNLPENVPQELRIPVLCR